MGADGSSRARTVIVLVLVGAFVASTVAPWAGFAELPTVGADTLVRLAGLGVVILVVLLLVGQKRRARGQSASDDEAVESGGSATDAHDDRRKSRRGDGRVRERAEQVTEVERDVYEWR